MKNSKGFIIEISSDLDYEEMVANILYDEETVAIVSQENGLENLEIEIFKSFDSKSWHFLVEDFLKAILLSKKLLTEKKKLS
jgi:hypothetical protein